ncbi:MAG: T9SS type A sorting domain-containing protein, partial [Flavobacteriales bacterium]|nr:T9SS type A sorting domain-containing protein [Flavobacteriales bacterium]
MQSSIPFYPDSAYFANDSNYFNSVPINAILGPWQDINPAFNGSAGGGGRVSYATYGVPPYRRFVASYDTVPMFSCTQLEFTNQIVIYESLNVIDINIANKPLYETWNGGAAIEGIQNQDGTEAYVIPGRNFPELWTAQYDSYRFVPLCDCPTDSLPVLGLVPGRVYWDQDLDCQMDQVEPWLPNVRIDIQPGNGSVWTNQNGEFAVMLEPGNYTFEHSPQNPWYLNNLCESIGVPVTVVADSNSLDVIFGDTIAQFVDINVNISTNAINACFLNNQMVQVCNNGTTPAYDIFLEVQIPAFTGTSNPNMTALTDSTWETTIGIIQPGECVHFPFSGITFCDSSMIGQVACLSAIVSFSQIDLDSTNNQSLFCDSVGVSYDPNDIRVLSQTNEQGWRTQEYIDDDDVMTYMVRFQNTGTGPAFNVIVQNPLSEFLDHRSIELIAASHQHYMQMIDGVLSIHFLGIELPDSASDPIGSQGFFIYRIAQISGNVPGTLIESQADIYFDFNAPVITNTTENEIPLITGVEDFTFSEIDIYPNPTSNVINLSNSDGNNPILSVDLFNIQGRLLFSNAKKEISQIDLSNLS